MVYRVLALRAYIKRKRSACYAVFLCYPARPARATPSPGDVLPSVLPFFAVLCYRKIMQDFTTSQAKTLKNKPLHSRFDSI